MVGPGETRTLPIGHGLGVIAISSQHDAASGKDIAHIALDLDDSTAPGQVHVHTFGSREASGTAAGVAPTGKGNSGGFGFSYDGFGRYWLLAITDEPGVAQGHAHEVIVDVRSGPPCLVNYVNKHIATTSPSTTAAVPRG